MPVLTMNSAFVLVIAIGCVSMVPSIVVSESTDCGEDSSTQGLYKNWSGCAGYDLPPADTIEDCEQACEEGGYKFCSYEDSDHVDPGEPICRGFFEEQESGEVATPGACEILSSLNWQQRFLSFPTCSPWQLEFEQCGGKKYTGETRCAAGLECVEKNAWFSSCKAEVDENCSPKWGTCGGIEWSGPTCCVQGTACVKKSARKSQCIDIFDLTKAKISELKEDEM